VCLRLTFTPDDTCTRGPITPPLRNTSILRPAVNRAKPGMVQPHERSVSMVSSVFRVSQRSNGYPIELQGLKPGFILLLCGTTEVVPCYKAEHIAASEACNLRNGKTIIFVRHTTSIVRGRRTCTPATKTCRWGLRGGKSHLAASFLQRAESKWCNRLPKHLYESHSYL